MVIHYKEEGHVDAILRETDGNGVDVDFDTIGGDTLSRSPDPLAQLGRVVSTMEIAQPQSLVLERSTRLQSSHRLISSAE